MTPTPNTGTRSPPSGIERSSARADVLRVEAVTFAHGPRTVIEGVSLSVAAGSFFALLGASGSGKTTLLKLLGGYLTPAKGTIRIGGRDVTALPPERRGIGMVFQSYALFPHLTARGNVSFGLEMRGVPLDERRARVEEALDRVALAAEARDRRPAGLSGGQQQRVALARALVIEPDLLLLDEPLANLDRRTSEQVRGELRALQRRTGVTTLLVTHDPEEALALADRIGVMAAGRLLQVGSPQEVYQRPACSHVARMLGDANVLEVVEVGPEGSTLAGGMRVRGLDGEVGNLLMVRPEGVELGDARVSEPFVDVGMGRILDVTYRGGHHLVELLVGGTRLLARAAPDPRWQPGALVPVHVGQRAWHVLLERDPPGLTS